MAQQQAVSQIPEPALARFLFADTRMSWVWLVLRIYVGWEWAQAGWEKVMSPLWTGAKAGVALNGFLTGAIAKAAGEHPNVQWWYAAFLHNFVQPNITTFSYMVAYGELLVGIGLILGIFTGIAAFFGAFMNMNYLFAGTVSTNPLLFVLELFLILAWRVAGWIGGDRWVLPLLGTPWHKGEIFKKKK